MFIDPRDRASAITAAVPLSHLSPEGLLVDGDLENYDDYDLQDSSGIDCKDTDCLLGGGAVGGGGHYSMPVIVPSFLDSISSHSSDTKDDSDHSLDKSSDVADSIYKCLNIDQSQDNSVQSGSTHDVSISNIHETLSNVEKATADNSGSVGVQDTKAAEESGAVISSDEEVEVEEDITQPSDDVTDIGYGQLEDDNSECDKENTPPCHLDTPPAPLTTALTEVVASSSIHAEESLTLADTNEVTVNKAMTLSKKDEDTDIGHGNVKSSVDVTAGKSFFVPVSEIAVDYSGVNFTQPSKQHKLPKIVNADQSSLLSLAASNLPPNNYGNFDIDDLPGKIYLILFRYLIIMRLPILKKICIQSKHFCFYTLK